MFKRNLDLSQEAFEPTQFKSATSKWSTILYIVQNAFDFRDEVGTYFKFSAVVVVSKMWVAIFW